MENLQAIVLRDIQKRFGRGRRAVRALQGVSIAVSPGEIYGLLGRNGAGKTTLVKILLDIVRADRGAAEILGLSSRSPKARASVGYLPEDHRFPDYQTGTSALAFHAALSRCPDSRKERFRELLDLVGLGAAAERKVRSYSKGMKQRLGLAQALVGDPRILFLDEPTDGVDPVGRAQIRDILVRLKGEGKTIFLNSHLLSEVERVCDRVGILDQGRLIREDTIEALTATDCIYEVQIDRDADGSLLEALGRMAISVTGSGRSLELKVAQKEAIDGALELLRSLGFGIRGLQGKRFSLEEVFLEAVEGKGEGGVVRDRNRGGAP